ncbi:SMI1/KNR4 family protein [Xenorhabdus szentirmaii]|uniref:Protein involved in beta-1 3-glucan synthesis-like protein n=2 Tax=Xenorhabdus szentirmaii TaxID=290112 RepID=W1J3K8_9GAMM|nr:MULTISPECIES: SMI1/KNR4 family protein [Xenorhabdus]MBD2780608.1 SMI1/KNR4 family protein [Xenorhabdus sp. 38]MBD2792833.1 SMI1/KNR4 family protein [Xenorhabdus sp. CUL]MBD2801017.1 SMI1/KNR4 family protein [Xenorhabdus sp. M]MBD2803213.1 SMI1/KNR4 family protein [Xenorhabdus sp. ZM]MBD2820296.1 SMI1/KNR4 family protein [Xenorhabdus sp. 42]
MSLLNEFEEWLKNNLNEVVLDLNPGATDEELQAFSSELGIELPNEFNELYKWHNGQKMDIFTGPWYGLEFLPLERVKREWQIWRNIVDDTEVMTALSNDAKSTPPDFVKKVYANKLWIPFAHDSSGNHLGIDLDPGHKGTWGQVISFGRDEERKIVIAPDIMSFVNWMLNELKSGNFNIQVEDDDGRSFNTLRPEKYHFLDSLAVMFPEV